ncbi:membrane protein DedA with SNARE-associated domain [Streptomyces sp. Amel2xB2]|uniref:DedA family protein n=1 Tax=Streptomyces sp. Amel2xB2 TaxID=1305829 RepID=UPI000DB94DB1|nr:VTT domain-containing protein [Streptomyces sp. Amel2xB2]RAJ69177.1 membrane protein DedA with SNARE-associated domain [Streptomyces sp. Amel2xB2]
MLSPCIAAGAGADLVAVAGLPPESTQQAVTYPSLFLLVVLGSLVPVVPTGALVSGAAVVALHQSVPGLALAAVFLIGAAAAFLGDVTLYWLGRRGIDSRSGSRWLERLREQAPPERLGQAQDRLRDHEVPVLIVSRLLPAGRIPVMLACLLARMPTREFVRGNLPACLAWAVTYQLIGLLSGSVFPEPWEGVAAAVVLTVVISAVPVIWRRLRAS